VKEILIIGTMFESFVSSAKLEHAFAPVYEFPGKSLPEIHRGKRWGQQRQLRFFLRPTITFTDCFVNRGSGSAKLRLSRGFPLRPALWRQPSRIIDRTCAGAPHLTSPYGANPDEFNESRRLTV
jgi:hypothetical protein